MKAVRVLKDGKEQLVILDERDCMQCGARFQPLRQSARFCSKHCQRIFYYNSHRSEELEYKDKIRHGNKKKELVNVFGLKCSECGKEGTTFEIIAHHVTGNNQEHDRQVLLCRSCHCRHHHSVEKKPIKKEQIEEVLAKTPNLFEACRILGINRSSLYQKRKKLNLL